MAAVRFHRFEFKIVAIWLSAAILLVLALALKQLYQLPKVHQLETCFRGTMNDVSVCPGQPDYIRLSDVSQTFIDALVVSEDAGFWHHDGFDWYELKESLKTNLREGSFKRGGSTISQQLIKNSFLSPRKSLWRKIQEFILTNRLESKFPKDFILEKYINIVEFGPELFGLKSAASYYFNTSPDRLSLLESAYLVHLLPSPKKYSLTFQTSQLTDFSRKMILIICKRLKLYKKISDQDYTFAVDNIDEFPWEELSYRSFDDNGPLSNEGTNSLYDSPFDDY